MPRFGPGGTGPCVTEEHGSFWMLEHKVYVEGQGQEGGQGPVGTKPH